jgi:hypothetical protein
MCTSQCTGACPGVDTFCTASTVGGLCMAVCNPTVAASCRTGYSCTLARPEDATSGTASSFVCSPE